MRTNMLFFTMLIACVSARGWCASPTDLPGNTVPEGLGVNIHFTDPKPGELEMLAQAGVRWVRMDLAWNGTEREKGKYDFSAYDRLTVQDAPQYLIPEARSPAGSER